MKYQPLLTSTFESYWHTVYPNTQLNLCNLERKNTLQLPLYYPQILNNDKLKKIEDLLELEEDKDFIEYAIVNNLLKKDSYTNELLEEAESGRQKILQFLGNDIWKQNEEAMLLLKEEKEYLDDMLETLISTENSDQTKERGIVIKHILLEDANRVIAWSSNEDILRFRLTKINQIYTNASYLMEKFTPLFNIKITPFIYFGENGIAEMFVEFEETFLLVRIMSNSIGAKLRWREDKQEVFIYRKNGKKHWNAATEAIQKDFKEQEILIRDYTTLMGTSTRQRRRPMLKVLLLEGSTIDLGNNPDYLRNDVPGHTYLNIRGNSNVFIFSIEALEVFLATVAVKKYFKRVPETGVTMIDEDCSDEELERRILILGFALQKTRI